MNLKNESSPITLLQKMVNVKKLRFQNVELGNGSKVSRDARQRRANFEEFKAVYSGVNFHKNVSTLDADKVPKTKAGSVYRFPKSKDPQFIETINIELPGNFAADRAVQLLENKIKPKKAVTKVNREVLTENIVPKIQIDNLPSKLNKIEEVEEPTPSELNVAKPKIEETQKQVKVRKETMLKNLPRVALLKPKRRQTKDRILNVLSDINEKLEKMQKKYFEKPRTQYRSVNDCFTQSGNVEIIYENDNYPQNTKDPSDNISCDIQNDSGDTLENVRMHEKFKEMNNLFPEFPKIEDTLKEIEIHLDNIVNLEQGNESVKKDSFTLYDKTLMDRLMKKQPDDQETAYWGGSNLISILKTVENKYTTYDATKKILKDLDQSRGERLRTIRQQIEKVEDFCDRVSEIANEESNEDSDCESLPSDGSSDGEDQHMNYHQSPKEQGQNTVAARFTEGQDLESSIKKSDYLSKEFGRTESGTPLIKVFSDNERTILWRKKMQTFVEMDKVDYKESQSVMKLIDNLKFTLENSLYKPVT